MKASELYANLLQLTSLRAVAWGRLNTELTEVRNKADLVDRNIKPERIFGEGKEWDEAVKDLAKPLETAADDWDDNIKRMIDDAKTLRESVRTPLEELGDDFKKWNDMRSVGLLGDEDIRRLTDKKLQEINRSIGSDFSPQRQSYKAEEVFTRRVGTTEDAWKPMVDELKKSNAKLQSIADAVTQKEEDIVLSISG